MRLALTNTGSKTQANIRSLSLKKTMRCINLTSYISGGAYTSSLVSFPGSLVAGSLGQNEASHS